MNPLSLTSLLTSGRVSGWRWSRPGEPSEPVLTGSCGIRDLTRLWVSFKFLEGATSHTLTAEREIDDSVAAIALDGELLAGRMTIKKALKLSGLSLIVVVTPEGSGALRFDGKLRLR